MQKGSELQFKLKNVDCDPKLKEVIIEQQQDIYFLRNQVNELANMLNLVVDDYTKIVAGCNNIGNELQNVRKALHNDEENEN